MVPPTISVTQHGASKMIISPPRINLRRAASYNAADRGPLSSSSARFGFDHLAFYSPPPSPGLPLPQRAPRMRRKPSNTPRPSRVIRCFLWLSGLVLFFYLAGRSLRQHGAQVGMPEMLNWARGGDGEKEYEMIGQDDLPDFPTPIVVTDRRGRAKWTVSVPPNYEFPLAPREYADIHFLDVRDAERQGFLPGALRGKAPGRNAELLGVDGHSLVEKTVCASSLTFVLESDDDAGLGKTLLALWMAYGLAQREGRAFFLDDARWAYGDFTALFAPPPTPRCRPPPRHEMLPCPRQARHLVVSAGANARDLFGGALDADADMYAQGPAAHLLQHRPGQRELFALARQGYEALFTLTPQDREYVFARAHAHRIKTYAVDGAHHNGRIVGVHVRHGDRHPLESQYADSYIPLTQYVDAAAEMLNASLLQQQQHHDGGNDINNNDNNGNDNSIAREKSFLVVASDDPLVYDAAEFAAAGLRTVRAQELIRLAGKEEVGGSGKAQQQQPKNVMHKFTDETFGWEGGFFAAMFWNLGASAGAGTGAADARRRTRVPPSDETIRLRSLVGRAYLMDLAALSAMTEGGGVVCAVSAMGCRILAVMMGEERAFGRGEWRNVDGGFGWNGFPW